MHLSKLTECIIKGVTPHVNDRLLLITMYQYWLSNSNKCTIMQDVNRVVGGRKRECMGGALYFLIKLSLNLIALIVVY